MARPNNIIVGGTPATRSVPLKRAEMIGMSVNDIIVDALNKLCATNSVPVVRFCTDRGTVDLDIVDFGKEVGLGLCFLNGS